MCAPAPAPASAPASVLPGLCHENSAPDHGPIDVTCLRSCCAPASCAPLPALDFSSTNVSIVPAQFDALVCAPLRTLVVSAVWAQSGALRRLEERRARREAARRALHSGIRRLKLPALFAPADSSASLRSRPAAAVAAGARGAGGGVTPPAPGKAEPPSPSADSADERDSAAERRRSARDDSLSGILNGPAPMPNGPIRAYSIYVEAETAMAAAKDGAQGTAEAAAGLDGSALTPHTLGRQPRGADHRINEDFNFGAYLSLCYVQLLADMIEFRPATWSFVIALTVAEGGLLYTGIDEMMIDLTIACCTAGLIGAPLAASTLV